MTTSSTYLLGFLEGAWDVAAAERAQFWEALTGAEMLCLFGAGEVGQAVAHDLAEVGIVADAFCDNDPRRWGSSVACGITCMSPEELAAHGEAALVLVTTGHHEAVRLQLSELGLGAPVVVPKMRVRNDRYWDGVSRDHVEQGVGQLLDVLADEPSRAVAGVVVRNWFSCAGEPPSFASVATPDQYFPRDLIELAADEAFVDGGAFTGDTLTEFLRRTNGRFSGADAYEIDEGCFRGLTEMVRSLDDDVRERIRAYNLGLYDRNGEMGYVANGTSSTVSSAAATETAAVVRLSDHCGGRRVSFVKMDIEGAEVRALHGAAETIRDCAPKLAVCVYHEPSHLWEVPLLAKALHDEYRVYLRHHSTDVWETVCYAVPR